MTRQRNADPMTKGLFFLAFWALIATGLMGLAGAWHPQTYTVVHAESSSIVNPTVASGPRKTQSAAP